MTTVYVYLPDEAVDVWRPVQAEQVIGNRFRIDSAALVPEDESWEFKPGELVECEWKELSKGPCLVAVRLAT